MRSVGVLGRKAILDRIALRSRASDDNPLPIGEGQTISQLYMVEALWLKGRERVLEIGTGPGYEAAAMAELCAQVFSVELVEDLAVKAGVVMASLGYQNVSIQVGEEPSAGRSMLLRTRL